MATWQGVIDGTNNGTLLAELEISDTAIQGRATVTETSGLTYSLTINGTRSGNNLSAALGNFAPRHPSLPHSGTFSGQIDDGKREIKGNWTTDASTHGTFHLFQTAVTPAALQAPAPQPTPQIQHDPRSAVSRTVNLPICTLDIQGLAGLIETVLKGTRVHNPHFTITHGGRTLLKAGIDAFVSDKTLPPVINEMMITANEFWENAGSTTVVVNLRKNDQNTVYVSGLDGAWVVGKCEEVREFMESYETPLATFYRKYGNWLNSIVFFIMLATLPDIPTFTQRATFIVLVIILLFLLLWSHQKAIPSSTIILKARPASFWDKHGSLILRSVFTLIATAISSFLAYVFAGNTWERVLRFFFAG